MTEKKKRQIQIDKFPDKLGNEQIKAVQSNFQGRNCWNGTTFICVNILSKIPLGNLRDVLLSATDLIYNIKCLTVGEGALSYLLVLQEINTM